MIVELRLRRLSARSIILLLKPRQYYAKTVAAQVSSRKENYNLVGDFQRVFGELYVSCILNGCIFESKECVEKASVI